MMNKNRTFQSVVWLVCLALLLLLSPLNLRTVLPTGLFTAPLTTLFAFVSLFVLPWWSSLALLIVGHLGLIFLHTSTWVLLITMAVALLVDAWMLDWHRSPSEKYSQSQLITIGLVTGITSLVLLLILAWLTGVAVLGSNSALNVVRLALPVSLLTCLVYELLIPLLGAFLLWLRDKLFPPQAKEKQAGSVVIDLSDHQDDKKDEK